MDSRIWQSALGALVITLGSIFYRYSFGHQFDLIITIISYLIFTGTFYLFIRGRAQLVVPDPAFDVSGSKLVLIIGFIFVLFGLFMLFSSLVLSANPLNSLYRFLPFIIVGFVLLIASKKMKKRSR
jgi:uncharacterized membrane protein HdeD (DUF308 family)